MPQAFVMDKYILDNVSRFHAMVGKYKPPAARKTSEQAGTNADMMVVARLRPLLPDETNAGYPSSVIIRPNKPGVVDVHELRQPVRGPAQLKSANYCVDRTYDTNADTQEIYNEVVKPLLSWAWNGGIGTLFAYGQTGSGKTYTVSRLEELMATDLMSDQLEGKRSLSMNFIELAGNSAYDLLNARRPISILEDAFGVTQLAGAQELPIKTTQDMLDLIKAASSYRQTQSTEKNDASSRSHAICRIRIHNDSTTDEEDGVLYLIDLAGSEAARDTANHTPQRMREAREINTSLSVLKDCIRGKAEADAMSLTGPMSSKKGAYVPFRQSPLTKLLKHIFDPATVRPCKTVVVACVNPCILDAGPSRNTLQYAETLRVIIPKNEKVQPSPDAPKTWDNAELKAWIRENSGTPAIDAALLAPLETGVQLLRITPSEFQSRCLMTSGVKKEQAVAFYSKFWQMHVDSERAQRQGPKSKTSASSSSSNPKGGSGVDEHAFGGSSSRELDDYVSQLPFQQRIRPGMVVSWNPPTGFPVAGAGAQMGFVLCPAAAAGSSAKDFQGKPVAGDSGDDKGDRYLCAMVLPGIMTGAYEISPWRQVVIDTNSMTGEVILEYDSVTRYYYMSV